MVWLPGRLGLMKIPAILMYDELYGLRCANPSYACFGYLWFFLFENFLFWTINLFFSF
jgi:hypothetical protein